MGVGRGCPISFRRVEFRVSARVHGIGERRMVRGSKEDNMVVAEREWQKRGW
jgi:hypothetical protein